MAKTKRTILGHCGEHFVASYLSAMGHDVTLTKPFAPKTDLIVRAKRGGRSLTVQVKTGSGRYNHQTYKKTPKENYWVWQTGTKAMHGAKEDHWFAFVVMGGWPKKAALSHPEVYFVPSKVVAKTLRDNEKPEQSWFWMYDTLAENYRGVMGYRRLQKAFAGR